MIHFRDNKEKRRFRKKIAPEPTMSENGDRTNIKGVSTCSFVMGYVLMILAITGCCFLYSLGTFRKFWGIFYVTGYGALRILLPCDHRIRLP